MTRLELFEEIAAIVAYHRKKAGLNRYELASLAGVGKTAIFDIEHGKKTIRLNTLTKVLAVLNISLVCQSPLMHHYEAEKHASS